MTYGAGRLVRVPLTVVAVALALAFTLPLLMSNFARYVTHPGFACARDAVGSPGGTALPAGGCFSVVDLYRTPFADLLVDATFRTLALLLGAVVLALALGTLVGVGVALIRRNVIAAGLIVAGTALVASVPAFFVAYFLQILVVLLGAERTGLRLVPVYGFGYDSHLVLPLLSISIPAITWTAQLVSTRLLEILRADFVTTAAAKGLGTRAILVIHVFPHMRPVLVEAVASGLRVSVASLPIIEYLFGWRGLGQLGLDAVGVHDVAALVFCGAVLSGLFATLSAVADLSRSRVVYQAD
ncbi:MAG TPA: ABC transporter permease subunit [Candidatus Dormibacteraeota bacterium]|nr:ABC transporter permease subunit [Candidatus Dormibacteraeota bacterium]